MSPRTGRPPSDNPKRNDTRIRMTDDEIFMLNYCCEILNLTKTEVISRGIKRCTQKRKKKQNNKRNSP